MIALTIVCSYPYVSSELFACENASMLDALFASPRLLQLLFSFLDHPAPLNPAHTGYFRKVVVVLIQKKHQQVSTWLTALRASPLLRCVCICVCVCTW